MTNQTCYLLASAYLEAAQDLTKAASAILEGLHDEVLSCDDARDALIIAIDQVRRSRRNVKIVEVSASIQSDVNRLHDTLATEAATRIMNI